MSDEEIDGSPKPGSMIETLRSLGYEPKTAIADIIDNSITAGAKKIHVDIHWNGGPPHSTVTISDNGHGMNKNELEDALRPGILSPTSQRSENDLGRFGVGMKTASWSMGRLLVVKSRKDGIDSTLRWDLDHVVQSERWVMQVGAGGADESKMEFPTVKAKSGTVVHIAHCDKYMGARIINTDNQRKIFDTMTSEIREYLEMVFHRFIDPSTTPKGQQKPKKVEITLNKIPCSAWDPFMQNHPKTKMEPPQKLNCQGSPIQVRTYILPHRDRLTGEEHKVASGPRGWNLQQGFYIYRANRLIVSGGWIGRGATKPEEHTKLGRIAVELNQEMDKAWDIDILKSKARPPANLSEEFGRIGSVARKEAKAAYQNRGKRAVGGPRKRRASVQPMWIAEQRDKKWYFKINTKHKTAEMLLQRAGEVDGLKKIALSFIRLIEKTIPIAKIVVEANEDEGKLPYYAGDETKISDDARLLFNDYLNMGFSREAAMSAIAGFQPFDEHIAILETLEEEGL
tara:strand:+ start:1545 stop:3080 length:1536 start_codon:yes stop_codon:yes gene_type:complete